MAKENVNVVTLDTQPAQKSIGDLRKELKELRATMLSTEQGTGEYNKALQKAADITHTLKEQTEEINATAMDFGQIASNVTKSVGGMVAGFQAAKATLSLFGIENEEVLQSLKKMQDLMAITQALPAIDNGIKAFKRLGIVIKSATAGLNGMKAALVSTGIGAIAVAVGLLAANWDKVTDAMKRWGVINEDTQKKIDEQKKKVEDLQTELKKLEGSYGEWQTQQKYNKLNKESKKAYDDLADSLKDYQYQLDIISNKMQQTDDKTLYNQLRNEGVEIKNNIASLQAQQQAILDNANSYKEAGKSAKSAAEEAVNSLNVLMQTFINSLSTESLQDELLGKLGGMPLTIPVKVEVEEEEEEVDTTKEDALRQKIESTVENLRNTFGMSEQEQYQMEVQALETALKTKLIKEEEYLKLRDALNKEQTQREMMRYASAAASIGDIFSNLGELMEEGSEEQKAFQIMGATVNMLGGITAAISGAFTTHSGPWDIALAVLQTAAIATSGAINIAKMSKTNEKNAKSMASSGAAATSAIQSITAPVQYTQDVQGASIEGAIKEQKVYVTETDISNTQKKVRVSESEATF